MDDLFATMGEMFNPDQSKSKLPVRTRIVQSDLDAIKRKIYLMLMQSDEIGLDDMGECEDAVNEVFNDWVGENNIVIID